ncbi:MAG: phosphatidylcholine/phosphatidylserine synthase [Acidobacteria bacterium]|nr:phosphatidylcholine/phosphatidylserine synthase [Acidobacteriota bacterium]
MRDKKLMGRGAYALPSIFTAGTIFCGYYALMKTIQAISLAPERMGEAAGQLDLASLAIGVAVFTDGMDGRIARLTNAVSDFGRELDSLADVITFGVAPALLAFAWGIRSLDPASGSLFTEHLTRLAYFVTFLFVVCGAARLARFNVQRNPVPKNPGRVGRKYFVGLPIPSAAALVAAVVHATGGYPLRDWMPWGALWLFLLGLLSFLMVCTWRYNSFKEFNLVEQRSWVTVVLIAGMIYLIYHYSQPVLLALASTYVASGILIRLGGLFRRHPKHLPEPERQVN